MKFRSLLVEFLLHSLLLLLLFANPSSNRSADKCERTSGCISLALRPVASLSHPHPPHHHTDAPAIHRWNLYNSTGDANGWLNLHAFIAAQKEEKKISWYVYDMINFFTIEKGHSDNFWQSAKFFFFLLLPRPSVSERFIMNMLWPHSSLSLYVVCVCGPCAQIGVRVLDLHARWNRV